jgi:hypothetical protein
MKDSYQHRHSHQHRASHQDSHQHKHENLDGHEYSNSDRGDLQFQHGRLLDPKQGRWHRLQRWQRVHAD